MSVFRRTEKKWRRYFCRQFVMAQALLQLNISAGRIRADKEMVEEWIKGFEQRMIKNMEDQIEEDYGSSFSTDMFEDNVSVKEVRRVGMAALTEVMSWVRKSLELK